MTPIDIRPSPCVCMLNFATVRHAISEEIVNRSIRHCKQGLWIAQLAARLCGLAAKGTYLPDELSLVRLPDYV